jgi:Domain of unknown function (DUF4345)
MNHLPDLSIAQRVVQTCLFLLAAIALFGGSLQMRLGQPDTSARLDNVHRFLAGIYLGCGLIALWAGITIRQQGMLVYLIALAVLLGGIGRLVSMQKLGLPAPRGLWLTYLGSELVLPVVIVAGQWLGAPGSA